MGLERLMGPRYRAVGGQKCHRVVDPIDDLHRVVVEQGCQRLALSGQWDIFRGAKVLGGRQQLLTCWLGFSQVGLEPYRLALTG